MKKINKIILTAIIALSSLTYTFAQSKVAHINTQELVASMPEMNTAKAELEKLAKTYETDIQTMAAELQSKVKQYDTEAPNQTDEENQKRLKEVQGMEQSIRQYQQQAQYDLQKKANQAKKKQKTVSLKEIKLRPGTETHDYNFKIKNAKKFITKGDKVKFTVKFKGREMQHTELGKDLMNKIIEETKDIAKVESKPKFEGRQMVMIIQPL